MAVIIGSARVDERGKYTGGSSTNNIAKEISTQEWYLHSKGWYVIRPNDPEVAEKIAKNMEAACESKYIGYDQGQNNTLYQAVKPLAYEIAKLKTYCETDCARLVRVCVLFGGVNVPDFYTGNMKNALVNTGKFTLYTSPEYCNSDKKLKRGDILVTRTKGHTVVVLSNGSDVGSSTSTSSSVLKMGSRGSNVKELQENLNKLGYDCGSADGVWGTKTENAVKKFQKDKGLTVDGIVGSATQAKIKECLDALNKPATSSKYNANVLKGQKWLNTNYSSVIIKATGKKLTEDGIFGTHSRNAALAVWKDVMNRKFDATFTISNTNFGDSCKLFAKNALVKNGTSGTFTYLCQFMLAGHGFYTGKMDGECGTSTSTAIGKFQTNKKLTVDKECGGNTWYKLFN